jgi:hypothetical protein
LRLRDGCSNCGGRGGRLVRGHWLRLFSGRLLAPLSNRALLPYATPQSGTIVAAFRLTPAGDSRQHAIAPPARANHREAAMRQTVIGLFNTYAEADGARNALVQSGFAYHEVELRANPETASDAIADESPGVLANIERFFASLFSTSGSSLNEPIAERYMEAVRGGAVLIAVDAATDAHAELAHNMLMRLGAREVSERARMDPPRRDAGEVEQARREHSMLDELGLGSPAAVPTAARSPNEALRAMEEERRYERMDAPPHDTPTDDDAARTAIAAGGAPGSGAVLRPDLADTGRRELDDAAMREAQMREQQMRGTQAPEPRMSGADMRDSLSARDTQLQRDMPSAPLTPPPTATPSAPPRDEFSRTLGGGSSSVGDEPATYPAKTVHGAAQYQSDPSDISRATPLPGEGVWQRDAAERSGQAGDMNPRVSEPGSSPNVRSDAPAGVGSDLYSEDGRGGAGLSRGGAVSSAPAGAGRTAEASTSPQRVSAVRDEHQPPQLTPDEDSSPGITRGSGSDADRRAAAGVGMPDERSAERPDDRRVSGSGVRSAAGTPGMMNEHEAREQLRSGDRSGDYSQPTVTSDATQRTASDQMRGTNARTPTQSDSYAPSSPMSQAPSTASGASTANQQAVRNAGDGDLGAPIPDEFLEYEEDFRLHYDEQFGAREGAKYDEYVPAYRYGATMGRSTRFQDRPWDDDVELEARHDWERAAPEGSWDRFKAAVRHGWERVTGHPHHH